MESINEKFLQDESKKEINDYELIEKFNKGEEEAFLKLMDRYKKISKIYIERYCTLYSTYLEMSEMYQLSLLSLYNSILNYDKEMDCTFSTYFSVVFEHDILMLLRHVQRERNKSNFNTVSLDCWVAESEGVYMVDVMANQREEFEPSKKMEKTNLHEQIDEVLHRFTKQEEEIFRMWMSGYTYKEMGEKFSVDKRRIEYIVRKIRKQLAPILKDWVEF